MDYLNTNWIGFLGIGGFVVGLMAMPLLRSNKKESQSGCGCGKKQYRSEMTQDVHAAPDGA